MGRNKLDMQRSKAKYRRLVAKLSQQHAESERLKTRFNDLLNQSRELLRNVKPGVETEEKIRIQDQLISQTGSEKERVELISKCIDDITEEIEAQTIRDPLKQTNMGQDPENLPPGSP